MKCPYCKTELLEVDLPAQGSVGRRIQEDRIAVDPDLTKLNCPKCDIVAAKKWWKSQARDSGGLPPSDR